MKKNHLVNQLIEAQEELEIRLKKLQKLAKNEPQGAIRVTKSGKYNQFRYRKDAKETNGVF